MGRGSRPKAGLTGFSVSTLLIPGFHQPWELEDVSKPDHIASGLDIMLEGNSNSYTRNAVLIRPGPIGSAAFNNEFGRPCITGYFRTLLAKVPLDDGKEEIRG